SAGAGHEADTAEAQRSVQGEGGGGVDQGRPDRRRVGGAFWGAPEPDPQLEEATARWSISQQCRLLALPRSSVYRKPAGVSAEDLAIMALIDRHYLARPYYGSRRMAAWLAIQGRHVNRKRLQRLMRLLGLAAIYQRPNTSKPAAGHKIYPYLLRGLAIERVN